jgi:hypothetical protein
MKPTSARISQVFGINPQMYAQFGLSGHNGIDFACPVGTPLVAPESGVVESGNDGKGGYGLYIRIFTPKGEHVLGHLSQIIIGSGNIAKGQVFGLSGNTGFSTGAHLHWGYRERNGVRGTVLNSGNGYKGYIDQSKIPSIWDNTEDDIMKFDLLRKDGDPTVYFRLPPIPGVVDDSLLYPATSEQIMNTFFGADWNSRVVQVPNFGGQGVSMLQLVGDIRNRNSDLSVTVSQLEKNMGRLQADIKSRVDEIEASKALVRDLSASLAMTRDELAKCKEQLNSATPGQPVVEEDLDSLLVKIVNYIKNLFSKK